MASSLSTSPSSPPRLDHSTLNLLDQFISQRSEKQAKLDEIRLQATRIGVGEIRLDLDRDEHGDTSSPDSKTYQQRQQESELESEEDLQSSNDSGESGDEQFNENEQDELDREREEEERLLEAEALADLERLVNLEYEEESSKMGSGKSSRVSTPPSVTRIIPASSFATKTKSKGKGKVKKGVSQEICKEEKNDLLTVDEFREIFTEDFQASQFCE